LTEEIESYNAADPKQVNVARAKAGRKKARLQDIVRDIMQLKQGREYFWDLLSFCGVFQTTFDPNPYVSANQEGGRNVGLKILADITNSSPDLYLTMMKEAEEIKK
jgi:hypothetical protein